MILAIMDGGKKYIYMKMSGKNNPEYVLKISDFIFN